MSTALVLTISSGLAPPGPLPFENRRLTGASIPGGRLNSGSSVSLRLSTTRCKAAPDWISRTWLSIVASSVPKFGRTDLSLVPVTSAWRGSINTVAVPVYCGVTTVTKASASATRMSGVAATIRKCRRKMRPILRKSSGLERGTAGPAGIGASAGTSVTG